MKAKVVAMRIVGEKDGYEGALNPDLFLCAEGLRGAFELPENLPRRIWVSLHDRPGKNRWRLVQSNSEDMNPCDWLVDGRRYLTMGVELFLDRLAKRHNRRSFYAELQYEVKR